MVSSFFHIKGGKGFTPHLSQKGEIKFLFNLFQKKGAGFTLTELLTVIAIISIISVLVLPNYRAGERSFALQRSAHKLSQDLRRAQEMAMSAKEFEGQVQPRYGVEFNIASLNYYILFADVNDNGKREPADQIIETIDLEKRVTIQQLFTGESPVSQTKIWITFKPPDPTTEIRDPSASGLSIAGIQLVADNQTRTIKINKAGLIYVE